MVEGLGIGFGLGLGVEVGYLLGWELRTGN